MRRLLVSKSKAHSSRFNKNNLLLCSFNEIQRSPQFFRQLLCGADVVLTYGRRYGLVGRNGAGKSTFLKMISS